MLIMTELIGYGISINVRRFVISVAMLAVSITLTAQLKPSEQEQQMVQRLQEAQMNGSDSDYYKAQKAFMDYLEKNSEWDKYYRTWMGRVIYEVNHKHFHRAFGEINFITDDVKKRHHEQYAYIANMCLGFFYNGRNQQDMAEKYFRRALQGIDVQKDPNFCIQCLPLVVANTQLQASCRSYGVSGQPSPADVAEPHVRERRLGLSLYHCQQNGQSRSL